MGESYSCAAGGVIVAGKYRRPSWRRASTAFTWGTIPVSNTLDGINPSNNPIYNSDYPSRPVWRLTNAVGGICNGSGNNLFPYSGAIWDESTGRLILPLQGGHGDHGGNDPYDVRLYDDIPNWVMRRPPSGALPLIAGGLPAGSTPQNTSFLLADGQEHSGVYADGRPRSMHSYRLHSYVPGIGPVMSGLGGIYPSGQASLAQTWSLDETSWEWTYRTTRSGYASGYVMEGASIYDPTRNRVWWLGAGLSRLWWLNLDTWTWVDTGHDKNTSGGTSLIYCKEIDALFEGCAYYTNDFAVWNPATGVQYQPAIIGAAPHSIDGNGGMAWCNSLQCMVILGSTGQIYTLTPGANPFTDAWTWGQITVAGTPSAQYSGGGTTSRFQYSERLNGFILLNSTAEQPYFLALD